MPDDGATHAGELKLDLASARLAPDMYTLAQQVQISCHHAEDGVSRLTGASPEPLINDERTIDHLKRLMATTVGRLRESDAESFTGAEDRNCSITTPDKTILAMNGLQFLRAWALPLFYFHVVTAYDILRHNGVVIGKRDYLSQVGAFVRPGK